MEILKLRLCCAKTIPFQRRKADFALVDAGRAYSKHGELVLSKRQRIPDCFAAEHSIIITHFGRTISVEGRS